MPPAFTCLECGGELHPNSRSCPKCGADPKDARARESDVPDDDFDYDDFVKQEFGEGKSLKPPGISVFWWLTAVLLFIAFLLLTLRLL